MIYFDNAATGFPKSERVFNAMKEAFFSSGNAGRSGHDLADKGAHILYNCRKRAGSLFDCKLEQVVLTKNATEALNLAIKGVVLTESGKKSNEKNELLFSSLEHNSVLRPIHALCKNQKLREKQFSVDIYDDNKTIEDFREKISKKTLVAVVIHASNVCGRILPVKKLAEISKENQVIFILDASQTAGHIPVSITDIGADIICMPGHKGLYGPMGTGLMLVNPNSDIDFATIMEGGTGIASFEREMPSLLPERLEYGTQNNCGFAGLAAALEEVDFFRTKKLNLFADLLQKMRFRDDIIMYGEPKDNIEDYMPVLLFNKKNTPGEEVAAKLNQKGIAVRAGFHCSPLAHTALGTIKTGGVRISLGRSNTEMEIKYFLDVL